MVGFCFRYHEVLLRAKKLVDDGVVGRLVNIRALMGEPFAEIQPNYMNMYYSKYSGAFELVHDLDLAIWFAGQEIEEVHAVYGSFSDMGMQSPDSIEMLLKFHDRLAANVHLDFYQHPRRRQIELMGVKGTVTVEFASWDRATLSWYNTDTREWNVTAYETARNDMFRDEDEEFLRAVMGECEVTCTVDEALKSLAVVESIYTIPEEYRK
jgi:predicted dehydrogenase